MTGWNRSFIQFPRTVWSLIIAGVFIRLPFLPLIGFEQDFLFFTSWASYMADHGFLAVYDHPDELQFGFVNYPPLYLYILNFLAHVYRLFLGGPLETRIFLCMIKLVTVFAEICIALMLYRIGEQLKDGRTGIQALILFFLNPAILYVSVYYGQVDAIFTAFLFASFYLLMLDLYFWAGFFAAAAFLTKIQTIPFIPLLFFVPVARRIPQKSLTLIGGFCLAAFLILSPYILTGRLGLVYQNSVTSSLQWGKYVTVGAFNGWYLHADPNTLDFRIWGWLFGNDGMLHVNVLVQWLTYRNLGVLLFGSAFLLTLYRIWHRNHANDLWIAASHLAFAFYMLPTKVHERYLFPFFLFYAVLAVRKPFRKMIFVALSGTYLINLMVICPLFARPKQVEEIDSTLGLIAAAVNVLIYILFLIYEYRVPEQPERKYSLLAKTTFVTFLCIFAVLYIRHHERKNDPYVLYLSDLTPVNFQQDWPENEGLDARKVIGHDLSVDKQQLRIRDTIYRYGLGSHANAIIEYEFPGKFNLFECQLGVDYEAMPLFEQYPGLATVFFEIYVNDVKRYESPLTIPTTPPRKITLPLPKAEGTTRLKLVVKDAGYRNGDHADWALVRVIETF